jgi:uncharacterized protein YjbI with pentapeptide repeats
MACSYRFEAESDTPPQLERYDGWQCDRETHGDADRCIFHLSREEKDSEAVTRQFLAEIRTEGRPSKTFIGAVFDHLDLSYASVDGPDNYPLVLHAADFGRLSLRKATVTHGLRFIDANVGKLNCFDAEFRQYVQLEDSIVGDPEFDEARFESDFSLSRSVLTGFARFRRGRFERDLLLRDTELDATRTNTDSDARRSPDFGHGEDFRKYDDFGSEFDFENVSVAGRLDATRTVVRGDLSLAGARLEAARLVDTTLRGDLGVSDCTLREVEVEAIDGDRPTLELDGVRIDEGTIRLDDETRVCFRDAVLSDVTFDAQGSSRTFEGVRFVDAEFDGFDFAAYSADLAADEWAIHRFDADEASVADDLSPSEGVSTYLRAKNGTNQVGDNSAAAGFFINEMQYRRARYRQTSRETEDIQGKLVWQGKRTANVMLDLSSGYGERPSRTVLSSLVVIRVRRVVRPRRTRPSLSSPLGYAVFSIESFVALLIGTPPTTTSLLSFVVAFEGFLGAFFIALFVFTLTRSIER